eukprot:GHRR01006629.1.p2 GENE.GHRR01006629.1~~GHRR01006629.1.p2  ORF type:complete len:156 (+),score=85.62 GHRR01006629.1:169-636(+)
MQPHQQQHHQQQQQQQSPELVAFERKWQEEYEGFKKLCFKVSLQTAPHALSLPICADQQTGTILPHNLHSGEPILQQTATAADSNSTIASQQAAHVQQAIQQAEQLLADVHTEAVHALSNAEVGKLTAKQLRVQRNQTFETAKSPLVQANKAVGV